MNKFKGWAPKDSTLNFQLRRQLSICTSLIKNDFVLLCGGWDGVIRIWENIPNPKQTKDIKLNAGVIQTLASSPNSKYVVAGTRNFIILVLNYPDMTE